MGLKDSIKVFFIACIISAFDIAGILIIFPYLDVVSNPSKLNEFLKNKNFTFITSYSYTEIILLVSILLVAFYGTKVFIQAGLTKILIKSYAQFTERNTNRTVSHVLSAKYSVFQERSVSEISGVAYSNTSHCTSAFTALVQVFNEFLVLGLIFIGFIIFSPYIVLWIGSFLIIFGLTIFKFIIKKVGHLSVAQSDIENIRYKILFSIATAIRDIKIMGLEDLFQKRNENISREYAKLTCEYGFFVSLPRLLIEFFALTAIVMVALFTITSKTNLEIAGPILGVIAIATVRVIPSFSRLFNSIASYRSSTPFVDRLINLQDYLSLHSASREDDNLQFMRRLDFKNICFVYGEKKILDGINLHLICGESIGIVGSSGAGKTTLLDVITGLHPFQFGEAHCDGVSFKPHLSESMHRMIGYVPQAIVLIDDSIIFNVSLEEIPNIQKVITALRMANLSEMIDDLPDGINTIIGENGVRLSGGQRQRLGIARALYREPQILIFDEATSSLDSISEQELNQEILNLKGKASIVIVAHRLSTVINCDRIYVLSCGKIEAVGSHFELIECSPTYQKLFNSQT